MAKSTSKSDPKSFDLGALELASKKYAIKDPVIIHRATDKLRKSQEDIFQLRVVSLADANGLQYPLVMNAAGEELDLDTLRKRDRIDYFGARKAPAAGFAPAAPAAGITINPTENHLTLNEGDTFDEVIRVTVPPNAGVSKADVYFLADTTGSMGSYLDAVKTGANNILTALNGLGLDFAYGVGNYKDFPSDPYAFQHQLNPTATAADVTTALNTWSASGGDDLPEGQFFALDRLAEPPGGAIGWRAGSKRIIVWFGDAPAHDPVCAAISGLAVDITEATVTAKLTAEKITVLAISNSAAGLDGDPTVGASNYVAACGAPGGSAGQATRITAATGGLIALSIDPDSIVNTIIDLVKTAVSTINNLSLVAAGATAPFVTSIDPVGGFGPLESDKEHVLEFKVHFSGVAPCKDDEQVFNGTLDVVADGSVVAQKRVEIRVPPCKPKETFSYSVKYLCGVQPDCECHCAPLRPGAYATDINIHNYHDAEVEIEKMFIPLVFAGATVGRAPRASRPRAAERQTLPAFSATMEDCCTINQALLGGSGGENTGLMIGFLRITSPVELSVTAVYTSGSPEGGSPNAEVLSVEGKVMR